MQRQIFVLIFAVMAMGAAGTGWLMPAEPGGGREESALAVVQPAAHDRWWLRHQTAMLLVGSALIALGAAVRGGAPRVAVSSTDMDQLGRVPDNLERIPDTAR
jgi:hypothetical protein